MSLKITTLIENRQGKDEKLAYEHGFSVLVEADGKRILFDTGQTGDFAKNADRLGISLKEPDGVVLSHGHYDHTGGVPALLERLGKKTPFYVGKEFFSPKYKQMEDGSYRYNGNPFEENLFEKNSRTAELIYIEESVTKLTEHIFLFKNFVRRNNYEKNNPKFFVKTEEGYRPDLFPDEITLGVMTEQGLVLVAGCSHVGIVNILDSVREAVHQPFAAVVGGTHLVEADSFRLKKTAEAFQKFKISSVAVSHCTGDAGMELLKREFPEGFFLNCTGSVLEF